MNLLDILQRLGIEHRDIRLDNIIVRDQKPVLINFGWAISKDKAFFTPLNLNQVERPLDGVHSDIYSMGKILDSVNRHKYPKFDLVIGLMTDEDRVSRITNLDCLKQLFEAIIRDGDSRSSMETKRTNYKSSINYWRRVKGTESCRWTRARAAEQAQSIQKLSAGRGTGPLKPESRGPACGDNGQQGMEDCFGYSQRPRLARSAK